MWARRPETQDSGYVCSAVKQGKNKADITWMSSASASLSPSAKPVPRQLCLDELLFDATAGSAATTPSSARAWCGKWVGPSVAACLWFDPAGMGCGSGLVSPSVPWDEFVLGCGSTSFLRMRRRRR